MLKTGELFVILDLHRQGLSVSAIARQLELDRKTVGKYIARGLEPPVYGPRAPRPTKIEPFLPFLRDRIRAYPELTGIRLLREVRALGYSGGYSAVKDALRELCAQRRHAASSTASRRVRGTRPKSTSRSSR